MKKFLEPVGFYTNGDFSDDAVVLEARLLLASRYGKLFRVDQAFNSFFKRSIKAKSPKEVLEEWDNLC
jgi:hypothetical protein